MKTTIHEEGNWKIKIYPDDHLPPHFHVISSDGKWTVRISDFTTKGRGNAKTLNNALRWARPRRADLQNAWTQLNERCP